MENYSLLMGAAAVMKMAVEMAGVDGEAFRGHFPVPAACRNRDSCPQILASRWRRLWNFSRTVAYSYRGFRREMNHIATGTAPSLDGELLPPHGSSNGDEDGGGDGSGVDGEAFRGHFPVPAACRNRDSCPPDLGFAMELFSYRGLFVSRLGLKVRAQPPPPSQPEPEPQSDAEYSSDNDEDPRLKEEYSEHDLRILEASQRKFCEDRAHRHYEAFARQQAILFFQKEISRLRTETGSLGSFLDATIAKSRQIENTETPNVATPVNSPESVEYSSDDLDEDYVELNDDFIEKCNATTDARKIKKLLAEHAVRYKPSPDPKFATSPINIRDKDYDFSLDLSHIAIVEKTPFCGTEKESAVEHMTELSTLSGVFSDDVKMRTYFVTKIFPFSLKDDAKTWYNNLPPGSIKSPIDLRDVFFRKYFPASAQHAALQRIYNFDQEDGEKLPEAWARFCSLIRAQPDHDLEKNDLLDIFYSGLTIESRAYLDSCAGCVFRKRTPEDAEELLAKIGRNHDDWSTPEPTPTPIVKKRGMIKLNDEDMREAKKSLKEKGIKPEDVKNLPPIEDICETIPPSSMIEYMKDIVTNKRKVPNEEISTMLANYSFNGKIPKKLGDPGAVIDCNKGMVTFNVDDKEHTVYFPKRIDKKGKMKKFKFGELFKKATTSTGRPSRASTQIRRSYNEDVIAPSFAPEEDQGAPNASSFPCYEFLTNAGLMDDFFTLVNRAGLATYVGDERGQYYRLTKIFVESFKFHNTEYEPTVAFKIYDIPVTMKLEEFCFALGIAPVGTARRIDDNPRDLLELYRGITGDDCRTIQRGKIRNIQLPAIKYFAYYIGTSILGRENTSNISSYHLAFLNVALTGETPYHLGSLIARRLSSRGPIFGGTIALRILTHLDIPLDSNDVPLTPRKLDIAAMKSHHFVTTNSTIDNIVYKMLFADGNEKEIPLPQQGLFNIDRQSWSLTKEVVEEHMKIQEFHQQHDSENAEPSYDYTVTYPDVSSSTYMEPGRSSSYYEDTTSWGPWE
ncbi:hypothetical protein QYE76_052724 [Lolium multiflorum]|uniref:Retrotransposon gag domain-containing protein n=1 Tax=Lolium multiflorum TaxID=4521 RepID=A0AAD8SV98_LOLMU|nr:hypothetical protein QYE76_052724 [Lolium multiflorum]